MSRYFSTIYSNSEEFSAGVRVLLIDLNYFSYTFNLKVKCMPQINWSYCSLLTHKISLHKTFEHPMGLWTKTDIHESPSKQQILLFFTPKTSCGRQERRKMRTEIERKCVRGKKVGERVKIRGWIIEIAYEENPKYIFPINEWIQTAMSHQ